jgi:predicted lipoprotein with Yx(FWY)xxD motif
MAMKTTLASALLAAAAAALLVAVRAPARGPELVATGRKAVVISTRKLPRLGTVLVDGKGRTLYMFVPDRRKKVTCVRACAAVWPPVMLPRRAKPVARGKAKTKLLGNDPDPGGGRVVTYNRWPLYTYVADTRPGQARGQALNLNGGLWYVLTPAGKVITRRP